MPRVRPIYSDTFSRRRRQLIIGIIALVVVCGGFLTYWFNFRTQRPSARTYPVLGVRLDQTDGYQDFSALHQAGVRFAYLKATEGASYFDDDYMANLHRANGTAVVTGAMHFFSFSSTPNAQADAFIKHVGSDAGKLPVAVEVNAYTTLPSKQTLAANLLVFMRRIEANYGRQCVVMGSSKMLRYVKSAIGTRKTIVVGASRVGSSQNEFWQFADSTKIAGAKYRGMVYVGSKQDFSALTSE
ncbi:MAG: 1,4-beta-N-acetylmuramidase [Lacticaseibacillus songhuajiangensis]|jgi:lysozyme|nr:1,4-beta-N-acetylmuramidase [Lacticaseibacillus songhuajiangensis]